MKVLSSLRHFCAAQGASLHPGSLAESVPLTFGMSGCVLSAQHVGQGGVLELAKLPGICLSQSFPSGCAVLVGAAGLAGSLVTRPVPVPVCRVVMDMDKDMARKEVLHAGRAPAATAGDAACDIEGMQQRLQLLGLNLQLIPHLNCVFSPVSVCCLLLSLGSLRRVGSPFA